MSSIKIGCYMALELLLRVLIHPRIRARCLAMLGARVGSNVRVYECTFINLGSGFSNLQIGDNVHIGSGCLIDLEGPVVIGEGSVLSPRVTLLSHSDPGSAHGSPLCERWKPEATGVSIGKHCWVGTCATLLSGAVVGDQVVVGASALVRGVLAPNMVYVGVPARPI